MVALRAFQPRVFIKMMDILTGIFNVLGKYAIAPGFSILKVTGADAQLECEELQQASHSGAEPRIIA